MAGRTALKLAEGAPFFRKELDLTAQRQEGRSHSLHYAVSMPRRSNPELAAHFIFRYSRPGELLLDPFAAHGDAALEAALMGRRVFASDTNPLALKITRAKLNPADITEVTLKLQEANLHRPVEIGSYQEYFAPFFDINTFRELANLRRFLQQEQDRVSAFIEFITLGLLHGHGAGYFSVYTFPHVSISPSEQKALNAKRGQGPDYRAVLPRILRRTASVLRDGIPSVLMRSSAESRASICDPRNLHQLPDESVDLIMTTPPLPAQHDHAAEMWLRCWFSGLSPKSIADPDQSALSPAAWIDYMNEVLTELARVLRGGRRAIIDLPEIRLKESSATLDNLLLQLVEKDLPRFWEPEGVVNVNHKHEALKHCLKPRESSRADRMTVCLVLRRR